MLLQLATGFQWVKELIWESGWNWSNAVKEQKQLVHGKLHLKFPEDCTLPFLDYCGSLQRRNRFGDTLGACTLTKNEGGQLFTCGPSLPRNAELHPGHGNRKTEFFKAVTPWTPRKGKGRASSPPFQKRMGLESILCNRGIHRAWSGTGGQASFRYWFWRWEH